MKAAKFSFCGGGFFLANTPFLTMFPFLGDKTTMAGGLHNAYLLDAQVDENARMLNMRVHFAAAPSLSDVGILEGRIRSEFALAGCSIQADYPMPDSVPDDDSVAPAAPSSVPASPAAPKVAASAGKILMGRPLKLKPVPMSSLTLESGKVAVEGDVIAVASRTLAKRGSAVLSFDITDRTNSIRVTRFLRDSDDQSIIEAVNTGDHLTVYGDVTYSKYDDDMVLDPKCIVRGKKTVRRDDAEVKRVELHLHTRFSNLDALTDPAAVVERAAYWGMPAIAVTDHGVAQAFPDMWKAGKKHKVKIIYGIEAYYVNDMDGSSAVSGRSQLPLDTEFVAFDTETTGINAQSERLTEIGACIFAGGEVKKVFNTFVNPGMHIPEKITELTGIRDSDVADAPSEEQALRDFIAFAGNRPVIAHNASFDMSFLGAAASRHGMRYTPVVLDTLAMSRALLPELKNHKLDVVSKHLDLPKFNHHRASDDAMVVQRIMGKFIPMLRARGAKTIDDIEGICRSLQRTESGRSHHMILLVQNKRGLKNLYELISQSYLKFYHRTPIVPKSMLMRCREGLIVGSACEAGELYEAVERGESDENLEKIAADYDYFEIQPLCNNAFLVDNGRAKDEDELKAWNRRIYDLGKRLGKPVVAASDVHFLDAEDEQYRHILLASKQFSDADRSSPLFFRTTDEMMEEFRYLGEEIAREIVIDTPRAIADQCEEIELLPKDLFPPKIEHSAEQLRDLVYEKMHRIYGENPPDIVKDRVDTELTTILDHHYDVIYMSAQKLVENSLEHGYLVGSRGSVGSSIVAFMSGITEVNSLPPHYVCPKCCHSEFVTDHSFGCGADMPEKNCPECGTPMNRDGFDIPFETFLGFPGNEKTPDIDLNFSGEYQAQAHKYTEVLFGSDHVFRAGTIGTLAEKTAYGYVKKYLDERGIKATKAEENRLALGLVGVKRTTGQHPGGLVVVPQDMDVTDFCPVQHPADDPHSDIITTHFEYHCMEANLLKLDELGHDDPTMIRMMEDMTGVDAKKISLSDPETMSIFTSPAALGLPDDDPIIGKTGSIGVPEFGTPFTRQMLVDTQPHQFDTLVRLSGFSHGTDVWAGNIRDLVTGGIASVNETIGCRDDIMSYLISKGMESSLAFKTMEAVRKGKVKKSGKFPDDAEELMRSMQVPEWWIESARKIAYLFPKAHAVAYVMMAFRIAWFKVHEPLAFYSAYFYRRSQKGGFDAEMMTGGTDSVRKKINEFHRKSDLTANEEDLLVTLEAVYEFNLRGLEFSPIDFYHSDATRFLITDDGKLLPPFVSISGLGESAALDLVRCRESGKDFVSVEEVAAACPKVSQTHIEILKKLGALGSLPETSQITLFDF